MKHFLDKPAPFCLWRDEPAWFFGSLLQETSGGGGLTVLHLSLVNPHMGPFSAQLCC